MKMTNENGRSMVEMLGVLAIIGVLSVGGIAGYTMAMNKYKANEIAAQAAQCGILAVAKASVSGALTDANCDTLMTVDTTKLGITSMTVTAAANADTSTVKVTMADGGVKTALSSLANGNLGSFTLNVS